MIKFKIIGIAITVACLGGAVSSWAADEGPHDKAIKGRQALMQLYSFNLGILGGMAKGKIEYNAEMAADAAANLHAAATMKQGAMWPAGSDSETAGNKENRALQAIWDTYPEVAEKGKALEEASAALMAAAGNGLDALKGGMDAAGKSCKGCHEDFRAEKK